MPVADYGTYCRMIDRAFEGMAERVKQAVSDLRGEGKTLFDGA